MKQFIRIEKNNSIICYSTDYYKVEEIYDTGTYRLYLLLDIKKNGVSCKLLDIINDYSIITRKEAIFK